MLIQTAKIVMKGNYVNVGIEVSGLKAAMANYSNITLDRAVQFYGAFKMTDETILDN